MISVGAHNDYGHPRPDTLAALARPGRACRVSHRRERTHRARVRRAIADRPDGASSTVGTMSEQPALKPAYLISGSDRPKVEHGRQRLRARFLAESVEIVSALEATGPTSSRSATRAACSATRDSSSSRRSTAARRKRTVRRRGGWKAADVEACRRPTSRRRRRTPCSPRRAARSRRTLRSPRRAPKSATCCCSTSPSGAALPGWPSGSVRRVSRPSPTRARCSSTRRRRGPPRARERDRRRSRRGRRASRSASPRSSSSSHRSPTSPPFALTDAWAERQPGRLLDLCETIFERSDKSRRDTAPRLAATLNGHLSRMRQLKRLADEGVAARDAATCSQDAPVRRARRSTVRPRGSPTRSSRARPCGSPSSTSR